MFRKLLAIFKSRSFLILMFIAIAFAIFLGFLRHSFYLHFINGLSYASVIYLLIGVLMWAYKEGDFAFYTWKKEEGSYSKHLEKVKKARASVSNPFLPAGLFLFIVSMILSALY